MPRIQIQCYEFNLRTCWQTASSACTSLVSYQSPRRARSLEAEEPAGREPTRRGKPSWQRAKPPRQCLAMTQFPLDPSVQQQRPAAQPHSTERRAPMAARRPSPPHPSPNFAPGHARDPSHPGHACKEAVYLPRTRGMARRVRAWYDDADHNLHCAEPCSKPSFAQHSAQPKEKEKSLLLCCSGKFEARSSASTQNQEVPRIQNRRQSQRSRSRIPRFFVNVVTFFLPHFANIFFGSRQRLVSIQNSIF